MNLTTAAQLLKATTFSTQLLRATAFFTQLLKATTFAAQLKASSEIGIFAVLRQFTDPAQTFEQASLVVGKPFVDGAVVSDTTRVQAGKALSESNLTGDQFERVVSYLRQVQDAPGTQDLAAFAVSKSFVDLATATEGLIFASEKVLEDSVTTDCDFAAVGDCIDYSLLKAISNTADTEDVLALGYATAYVESGSATDVMQRALVKAATDASATADSGVLFYQNYGSSNYFSDNFVGVSTSF